MIRFGLARSTGLARWWRLLLLLLLLLLPLLIDIVSKSSVVDPTLFVHLALRHDLVDNRVTKLEPQLRQDLGKIFGMSNSWRRLPFASRGNGAKCVKHGQSDGVALIHFRWLLVRGVSCMRVLCWDKNAEDGKRGLRLS